MTFGTRVTALTQNWLLPKVVDNILNGNVLAFRLMGNAQRGKGTSIDRAIKYTTSGAATSFSGFDTFTASPLNTKVTLSYDMRGVRIPIGLSGMEVVANKVSETQITDLVQNSIDESQQELLDTVGTMLYGTGTGNSNKDFIGLGGIVDDGTDVSTIGGLSRTTYSVLNATRTASGGTLTLAKLATLYSAVSGGGPNSNPTLIVSNETVDDFYETLLTPTVRETYSMLGQPTLGLTGGPQRGEGLKGTAGFVGKTYKGIFWGRDEKSTAQNIWMLNENQMKVYGWDASGVFGYSKISLGTSTTEGVYGDTPGMSDYSGFNWSGFRAPTDQFAGIADVIQLANLTSWAPRRQGRLTGETGA